MAERFFVSFPKENCTNELELRTLNKEETISLLTRLSETKTKSGKPHINFSFVYSEETQIPNDPDNLNSNEQKISQNQKRPFGRYIIKRETVNGEEKIRSYYSPNYLRDKLKEWRDNGDRNLLIFSEKHGTNGKEWLEEVQSN